MNIMSATLKNNLFIWGYLFCFAIRQGNLKIHAGRLAQSIVIPQCFFWIYTFKYASEFQRLLTFQNIPLPLSKSL